MEKYESIVIDVVEFDERDVVATSPDGVPTDPVRSFNSSLFHITEDTLFSYEWFLKNDDENKGDE